MPVSKSVQNQLEKLAKMLQEQPAAAAAAPPTSSKNDMAVILQEEALEAMNEAAKPPMRGGCGSSCGSCAKNGEMLIKIVHMLEKLQEDLIRREEEAITRAERLERADQTVKVLSQAAVVDEPAAAPMPPQLPPAPPAPPKPAFTVTEVPAAATTNQPQPPQQQPLAAVVVPTTFEEVARGVSDVPTLCRMLNDQWRERTKALYSAEQLAAEPTEPPCAMDVFRDKTAELAQEPPQSKQEFIERLRLVLKQTAPGIIATTAAPEHAHARMVEMWGPEWCC
jgi:hypothetical protein